MDNYNFIQDTLTAPPVPNFKRKVLVDMVYDYILDGIINGTFKIGDKINAESLSRALGVSRTPVREALRSLEQMGVVVSIPYFGMQVSKPSINEIREIYEIRLLLEPYILQRTVECITDEEIKELEQLEEEIEDLLKKSDRNTRAIFQLNQDFHMQMFGYSNMKKLCNMLKQLWYNLAFFRLILANQESYPKQLITEHRAYIDALKKRDAESILSLCRKILCAHAEQMPSIVENYYSFLESNK